MLKQELQQRLEVMSSNCRLLVRQKEQLEARLSVNKTYCDRIETDNKLLQKELVTTTKRHREIISKQQSQIEDLKDTVRQLLDMIDEIRETGEINW